MKEYNAIIENYLKTYNEETIGNVEKIYIDGVGESLCKVDTGNNAFNVIHGVNIKINNGEVEFDTINNKRIKKKIHDGATINIGSGIKESRPIITFNVKFDGEDYRDVKFTLSNRAENSEPILLGKEFLSIVNKLIDINKDHITELE